MTESDRDPFGSVQFGCAQFAEMAPEVAMGLVAGHEFGRAVGHLTSCRACRDELAALVRAADALVLLTPPVEPPLGFDSQVIARLADDGAFRGPEPEAGYRRRLRRAQADVRSDHRPGRWKVVLVAAALLVAAGTTGLLAGRATKGHAPVPVSAGSSTVVRTALARADDGQSTCRIVVLGGHGGEPTRVVIQLDEPGSPPDTYEVQVEPVGGGSPVQVGSVDVRNGQGLLATAVASRTGRIQGVRVIESGNSVKYRATFAAV